MGFELIETCDKCERKMTSHSFNKNVYVQKVEDRHGKCLGYLCRQCYDQYYNEKIKTIEEFDAAFFPNRYAKSKA
jgi:hypothetical protein